MNRKQLDEYLHQNEIKFKKANTLIGIMVLLKAQNKILTDYVKGQVNNAE